MTLSVERCILNALGTGIFMPYTREELDEAALNGGTLVHGKWKEIKQIGKTLNNEIGEHGYSAKIIRLHDKEAVPKIVLIAMDERTKKLIHRGRIKTIRDYGFSDLFARRYCKAIFMKPKIKYSMEKLVALAVKDLSRNPYIRFCPIDEDMDAWRKDKENSGLIPAQKLSSARYKSVLQIISRLPNNVRGSKDWKAVSIYDNLDALF